MANINESNIQLLCRVASLQVASYVDVIVSDNAGDDVRCGDALRPCSGHKHAWHLNKKGNNKEFNYVRTCTRMCLTGFFNVLVHVFWARRGVGDIIMGHKVNLWVHRYTAQTDFCQLLCDIMSSSLLWPCVSWGTQRWGSREHHATPHLHTGSASGLHNVHPLSSPCSL